MPKEKEEKYERKREESRGQHVWGGELGDSRDGIISCIIGSASRAAVSEVAIPTHPPSLAQVCRYLTEVRRRMTGISSLFRPRPIVK